MAEIIPIQKPKGRAASREHHEAIYDKINERLPEIVDAMIDLALGNVEVEGKNGKVYTEPPSLEAQKYLVDRVMGRPLNQSVSDSRQTHDVSENFEQMVHRLAEERKKQQASLPPAPVVTVDAQVTDVTERAQEVPAADLSEVDPRAAAIKALGLA